MPAPSCSEEVARSTNVELRENIDTEEIHRLVREAQVNVLPTFQATGIKLKLLLCLFTGRHVVCNTPWWRAPAWKSFAMCTMSAGAMRTSILACMGKPANGQALERRAQVLEERFSNRAECGADRGVVGVGCPWADGPWT